MITGYSDFEERQTEEAVVESLDSMVAPTVSDAAELAQLYSQELSG